MKIMPSRIFSLSVKPFLADSFHASRGRVVSDDPQKKTPMINLPFTRDRETCLSIRCAVEDDRKYGDLYVGDREV